MSLYRYRAKDRKGHKYKGIREGENEAQLVKSLAEDGLYCYFLQNEDRVVSMRHFTVPLKWLPPFCSPGQFYVIFRCSTVRYFENSLLKHAPTGK